MYENGKRVNGYRRKRIHKRKMKQSYAKGWVYGEGMTAWNNLVLEYTPEHEEIFCRIMRDKVFPIFGIREEE